MNLAQIKERLDLYRKELRKKLHIILASGITLGILMGIWGVLKSDLYTAKATFHPESGDSGGIGSLADPLSFILGGPGGRGGAETAQIMEVLQSRHLSESVAKDSVLYQGEDRLIADLVIETVDQLFGPYYIISGIKSIFIKPDSLTLEKKIIVAGRSLRKELKVNANDNGFLEMEIPFFDKKILQVISNLYIEKLSVYYRNQQTEKAKANLKFYTNRADSVAQEIDKVNRQLAQYVDQSGFSISAQSQIKRRELTLRLEFLSEMYKPLILNKEQAVSQLQQDTPIIQVLDPPIPPFEVEKPSLIVHIIVGLLLGMMLMALFFIRTFLAKDIAYVIKESLKDEPEEAPLKK